VEVNAIRLWAVFTEVKMLYGGLFSHYGFDWGVLFLFYSFLKFTVYDDFMTVSKNGVQCWAFDL